MAPKRRHSSITSDGLFAALLPLVELRGKKFFYYPSEAEQTKRATSNEAAILAASDVLAAVHGIADGGNIIVNKSVADVAFKKILKSCGGGWKLTEPENADWIKTTS